MHAARTSKNGVFTQAALRSGSAGLKRSISFVLGVSVSSSLGSFNKPFDEEMKQLVNQDNLRLAPL